MHASSPQNAAQQVPRVGISVAALRAFVAQHETSCPPPTAWEQAFADEKKLPPPRIQPFAELTTGQVCARVVRPATKELRVSYAELLGSAGGAAALVGTATVFVSHAWDTQFRCLYEALLDHFGDDSRVFLWLDIFVQNQHIANELAQDYWATAFQHAVASIGHTVLMLHTFDEPLALSRSWCLWEILASVVAMEERGCTFEVLLEPAQCEEFARALWSDFERVDQALSRVDMRCAKASVPADKEMIDAAVLRRGGFEHLNAAVAAQMRQWLSLQCMRVLAGSPLHDPATGAVRKETLWLLSRAGRLIAELGDTAQADELLTRAALAARDAFDAEHPEAQAAAANLGGLRATQGNFEEALPLLEGVVAIRERTLGEHDPLTTQAAEMLAAAYSLAGRPQAAAPLLQRALSARAAARPPGGLPDRETLLAHVNYAETLIVLGDAHGAEGHLREARDGLLRVLGPRHKRTLSCASFLADLLISTKRLEDAAPLAESAASGLRELTDPGDPSTLHALNTLGRLRVAQGAHAAAHALFADAVARARAARRGAHSDTLTYMHNAATQLLKLDRAAEAQALYEEELAHLRAPAGGAAAQPDSLAACLKGLCRSLVQQQLWQAAEPRHAELCALLRPRIEANEPGAVTWLRHHGVVLSQLLRNSEAEALAREVLARRMASHGEAHAATADAAAELGALLAAAKKHGEAREAYATALRGRRAFFGPGHADTMAAASELVTQHHKCKAHADAEDLLRELLALRRACPGGARTAGALVDARRLIRLLGMMPGREADADAAAAEAAEYIIAMDAGAPVVATQEQQDALAALLGALDKAGTPTCRVAAARIRTATAAATVEVVA